MRNGHYTAGDIEGMTIIPGNKRNNTVQVAYGRVDGVLIWSNGFDITIGEADKKKTEWAKKCGYDIQIEIRIHFQGAEYADEDREQHAAGTGINVKKHQLLLRNENRYRFPYIFS